MSFLSDLLLRIRQSRPAKIGIAAGLLLVCVLTAVIYFLPKTHELARDEQAMDIPVSFDATYEDGVHTVTGSATLKNRCQPFDASAVLDSNVSPNVVRVELLAGDDEGVCLQIPEVHNFDVSVEGPEDARVEVFVNGVPTSGSAI